MKSSINKNDYETRRLSHNFQRWNTNEQRINLAFTLAESTRKFADISINVVRDELLKLGMHCDIIEDKRNHTGNFMYHINKQWIPLATPQDPSSIEWDNAGQWQIVFTIMKNGTFKLRCNIYGENKDFIYYMGDGLSTKDLLAEMLSIKLFLDNGTAPAPTSKLKQESEVNDYMWMTPEEMAAFLDDYEPGSVK